MLTYGICIVCTMKENYASGGETRLARPLALRELRLRCEPHEAGHRRLSLRQQRRGAERPGEPLVPLQQLDESVGIGVLERDEGDEVAVDQPLVRVEQERLAARHPRSEVAAVLPEDD